MDDLKERLESLLFASGRTLSTEQLAKLARIKDIEAVRTALKHLAIELIEKNSSITLIEENDTWRLSVKEKYLPYVRRIVTKTELPKTILETLAITAYKAPCLQSDIIKIRTNKGYDHLNELEKLGYISREKKGRTKLIKLTQKFYNYFDLPPEKIKERLSQAVNKQEHKLQTYNIPPGQEHEHALKETPQELTQAPPKQPETSAPEEKTQPTIPSAETAPQPTTPTPPETTEEPLQPEVKEMIKKTEEQKITGMYPEGVPEDIEKEAEKKAKKILTGEEQAQD